MNEFITESRKKNFTQQTEKFGNLFPLEVVEMDSTIRCKGTGEKKS